VFRRDAVPADLVGRAVIDAWQSALLESGLDVAQLDGAGRPRIAFGAPLPAAAEAEAELAEIFLAERVPAWHVREALGARMPPGHVFVSAEDVWLGAPPLPGRVIAAEWRIEIDASPIDRSRLAAAAADMIAANALPRVRSKAGIEKSYDLRPLLDDIRVDSLDDGSRDPLTVRIRTRFRPELGSGRPDEVIAALAEAAGTTLTLRRLVRERLVLASEGA
jgi:radical SAM-linked protein